MLQLIAGRSGSGKTEEIWQRIQRSAQRNDGRACVLLVPEQFSFETERALLWRFGPSLAFRVKVYSFTRMAEMVRREVGGRTGSPMAAGTRVLLLAKVLAELNDQLTVYRSRGMDASRMGAMLRLLEEWRSAAITEEQLVALIDSLPDSALRSKLKDIYLIDHGYEALVSRSYLDPMDELAHLAEDLPQSRLFAHADVYVDGFKGFTGQEQKVLTVLMSVAERVTIALGYDPLLPVADDNELFSLVQKTASQLENTARASHVPILSPCRLTENRRHTARPALSALEERLYRPGEEPFDGAPEGVTIYRCSTIYRECAMAVREIHRYLRQGGRCHQVAVAVRQLSEYRGILDGMLKRAGIPHYLDCRESVRTDPLIVTVLGALQCVCVSWQTESLLRLMKTGLLGFSAQTVAQLENYVTLWGIRGAAWKQEWTFHPDGLTATVSEESCQQLAYLNLLRRRVVRPLLALQQRLSGAVTGREWAEAVYDYLKDARVDRLTRLRVHRLTAAGDYALADRSSRVWDTLMNMLDQFATAAGEETQQASELLPLFSLAADMTDLGSLPPGLDVVQIGQADRMRYSSPELVLILGANEGVFPSATTVQGLLSDGERRLLVEYGLPIKETSDRRAMEERYLAYAAVAAPSRELIISYREQNADGALMQPSSLVWQVQRLLPKLSVKTEQPEEAETPEELLNAAAERWKEQTPLAHTLRTACAALPETAARFETMRLASEGRPAQMLLPHEAKRLFSGLSRLSPTAVERGMECRFGYFCEYGLRIRKREKAELNALTFGQLAHAVMERCVPAYVQAGYRHIKKETTMADARAAVYAYADEKMGGLSDKSDRFCYQLERLARLCGYFLWQVVRELRQSRFIPTDYELSIGDEEGSVKPLSVKLADGTVIRMVGTIDRVDVYRAGDFSYVRVVDYKTGQKDFRLDDVVNGINLQMLIYLSALWENGGVRYGTVVPAGMLYLPTKMPAVSAKTNPEKRDEAQVRTMRMNGLVLDNPEIVSAMEAEGEGLFIPVKLGKNGGIDSRTTASVATLAQFGQLKRRAEALLRQLAEQLRDGDVDAAPAISKTVDACRYCDYRVVCGHEAGQKERRIPVQTPGEVYAFLADEEAAAREEE